MNIYPVVLQVVEGMRDVLVQVERHDKDLARQGRRAALSILLNVKEAMHGHLCAAAEMASDSEAQMR